MNCDVLFDVVFLVSLCSMCNCVCVCLFYLVSSG